MLLTAAASSIPAIAFGQPQSQPQPYPQCTKTVGTNESDLAHQKYIAGKQDYDEGNYESAVRRFRDAYNLDCTKHELLIIISAAYEKKGDLQGKKEALNALETYVSRAPSAPDLSTYQSKIDNLKKQIATAAPPSSTPAPSNTAPPSGEMQEHTPYPWIVAGVGVVALSVGIVLLLTSNIPDGCDADNNTCTPRPGDTEEIVDKRRKDAGRIKGLQTGGLITTVGGAVIVVGGLVWHFLEPTGPKEASLKKLKTPPPPSTRVTPEVAPGFAGVSFGGTF